MKKILIYIIFMLAGVLSACQDEEEFKIPTDVAFQADINRNASTNGRLHFSHGHISLASFAFDGRREEGGDVYFEKQYVEGLSISFGPDMPAEALKFQIPQGNYTRIEVELETLDELDKSGLAVTGSYLNASGITYPIRFELASALDFEIASRDNSGNSQIILKAGTPANAIIKLDPIKWFETVPASYLDNAVLVVASGEGEDEMDAGASYILINEETNENIYEIILNRIEQSTETIFN